MGSGDRTDVLEVARFSTLPEGELAVALLRDHGIDAIMPDRQMANSMPHLQFAIGGIRVVAPEHQIAEARALIDRARRDGFAVADDADGGDWAADHTPGRIGELHDNEVAGALGGFRRAAVFILAFVLLSPVAGCLLLTAF